MSKNKSVFVFGSNEAGIHGAGAAKIAYEKHGARWFFSYGHYGNSFAIPTKNQNISTMQWDRLVGYVQGFIAYAKGHPELTFQVTQIGCGLAGYLAKEIAPLFEDAPVNCQFDSAWKEYLGPKYTYWGTFP